MHDDLGIVRISILAHFVNLKLEPKYRSTSCICTPACFSRASANLRPGSGMCGLGAASPSRSALASKACWNMRGHAALERAMKYGQGKVLMNLAILLTEFGYIIIWRKGQVDKVGFAKIIGLIVHHYNKTTLRFV